MWLRCDNAGAYHSQLFVQALYALRNHVPGLNVKGLYFSEPGMFISTHFIFIISLILLFAIEFLHQLLLQQKGAH